MSIHHRKHSEDWNGTENNHDSHHFVKSVPEWEDDSDNNDNESEKRASSYFDESSCSSNSSTSFYEDSEKAKRNNHNAASATSSISSVNKTRPWEKKNKTKKNDGASHQQLQDNNNNNNSNHTHLSFAEMQFRGCYESSLENEEDSNNHNPAHPFATSSRQQQQQQQQPPLQRDSNAATTATVVPEDQERQILLLMLLAQVCALHDPTPRTFTVHVLELFERGMLDRQSIHFLYDLGLVPMDHHRKLPPWQKPSHLPPPQWTLETSIPIEGETSVLQNELQETRIVARTSPSDSNQTNETTKTNIQLQQQQRSMEVTAIRSILEQHEQEQLLQKQKKSKQRPRSGPVSPPQQTNHHHPKPLSWSVEEHPLSLSRYQREFEQIGLLNTGAFGQVYEAKSKMDGREYAIKRVPFAASGYSRDSVQRVVREVHCLAVCDHPHVVRYYTSWLEPSWMTGSTAAGDLDHRHQVTRSSSYLKLLTDVEQLVSTGKESEILSDDLREYFKDRIFGTTRRKSVDDMLLDAPWDDFADEVDADDEYSEWTVDACKDDIFIRGYRSRRRCGGSFQGRISAENENGSFVFDSWRRQQQKRRTRQQPDRPHYNYQICLFIQMQLCHPATLADWIRARNENMSHQSLGDRLDTAAEVFGQIASGLSHVHARGIVHRDLKPANVFASADGLHFKIGDFGLSKMIENASSTSPQRQRRSGIYHREQQLLLLGNGIVQEQEHDNKFPSVRNPLTAGVGTASYAAPEQVATSTYGTQADIFSLGLIFLEMLCCFSTEHERLQTFQDCRNRRVVPQELKLFPAAVELILACTDPNPEKRPTAQNLCSVKLKKSSCNDDADVEGNREEALRLELLAKERELSEYKEILQLKDQIIQEQQMRIESLQKEASKKTQVESAQCFKKIHHEDASEPRYLHGDSSSEDDI